ncbi:hypothetical protein CHLNCDRAFT_134006 [Chlorella variabilis]|uniref:Uncharacterized protein n=1 Tax=Chlorella variabilis TaxID=554065 RepID=E1ZES3_CHLVA|nr:hypothetical protein CHLNCDRAFT_134006 [Chlorella variabilis]EFN55710.1 hypothetical protein CHLNCDRAFT_134006 [Chlorella variabilis]|eukprot:XP_005847812.1 hypothetical protein CHLNCDRAFT_134006 [Chlorella variabilis]
MAHQVQVSRLPAAAAEGVVLTNWVDVIKVRQQLAGPAARNLAATGWQIVRREGPLALGQGITPAVARGVLYGGLRIGLYTPMKSLLGAEGKDSGIAAKVAAGMLSGALAAGISNPTDLVKTHMQKGGGSAGGPFTVMARVVRSEGVRGLWVGTTPSMARAALLTASQCATYDELKLFFVRQLGWEDNLQTHFAVSGLAGLVTTTVTAPVDMIKTNLFVNRQLYTTPAQCLQHILREQGVRGFFRGWGAMWARQGPMTTCIFVINEWLRGSMGLATL